jgi:hypothetical protein
MFRRSGRRFADKNMRKMKAFGNGAAAMARTPFACLALTSVAAAIAGMAAIAAAPPAAAEPRGVLGAILGILGGSHDGRYAPVAAYAPPSPPASTPDRPIDLQAPAVSGGNTWCVRLCDGRYFPLSAPAVSSRAGPAKMCSALCPAAKTAIYSGGDIDSAYGARGERYADLDNAFVYRQKLVPDCTCNGRDAFGLAHIDADKDPTLQAGDIVATRSGLQVFRGAHGAIRSADFSPIRSAPNVSADLRRELAGVKVRQGH